MTDTQPAPCTAADVAALTDLLGVLAPGISCGTQGGRGRLWACLTTDDGFSDDEASLLHSVGLVVSNDRCLIPPARVVGVVERLRRVARGAEPFPLAWRVMVRDPETGETPASIAWFDGQVCLRFDRSGEVHRWERFASAVQLDRYLRACSEYDVLAGPFDAMDA